MMCLSSHRPEIALEFVFGREAHDQVAIAESAGARSYDQTGVARPCQVGDSLFDILPDAVMERDEEGTPKAPQDHPARPRDSRIPQPSL